MANNFNWVNATTLNGVFWDNGTLFSADPITQIGTLTIERLEGRLSDKVLDAQLNNTGNIVASFDFNSFQNTLVAFADGAILNNSGNFELQSGAFRNISGEIGTFNNSGTLRKTTALNGEFGVTFNNTGTVNVELGILTIGGGGVSDGGIFNITSGKTLKFDSLSRSVYTLGNGSKINGNGNLTLGYGIFDLKLSEGADIANTVQFTIDSRISSAQFGVDSDRFQVDGNWTLPTTTKWNAGYLKSAGILTNSGSLTISSLVGKVLDAQLNNTGNIVTIDGDVYFKDGAILNNSGNYELQSGGVDNVRSAVGTFNNSGTVRKTTTGDGGIRVAFNNTGTVNVESGSLTLAGGGVSDGGIFNITSGKTLKFDGSSLSSGYTLGNGSKINGNGNLTLEGYGLFDIKLSEGAAIASTVQFTIDSTQFVVAFGDPDKVAGFQVDQDWTLPTTTKWNGGLFKSTGILTNKGSLTIGGVQTKYFDAQLNNTGNIVGNFRNELVPGVYNLIFQVGSVLNNSGNFKLQSGTTGFLEGAIFNNYGNFELQEANIATISPAVGTFNNFGTLKTTTALFGEGGRIGVVFNNKGTVNVESGSLDLGGGVSDGGTFNLTSGKTLSFVGGVYTLSNGTKINGNGNLTVGGSSQVLLKVSEGATIAHTVKFTLSGASGIVEFRVDGDWTLPTTTNWGAGTFKSTEILTNSGNLNLNLGGLRYLDAQLNNTGNIFHDRGNLNFLDGAILNNFGNYELLAAGIVSINGGTFNNSGTYKKTLSELNVIGVTFNNTGTVEARSGTIDFIGIYTHNNAKLILSGGNFIFRRALTINGGSIEGNGSIDVKDFEDIGMTNSGLLNPRLASNTEFGRLTINNSYTETDNARINIQLGGNTAGINFDQIDINGKATFDGTLNVSLLNGFTPTLGSTFDILTFDSLGNTSELDFTGLAINSTLQFAPQWSSNKLTLKVVEKVNAALAIAPTKASQTEGTSGNKVFTFTVTRTENTLATESVNWAVTGIGINPANATDFGGTLSSGIVTFAPGATTQLISVNVKGDISQEANEQFRVTLSNPSNGAILTNPRATGTILNDDIIGNNSNNNLKGTANNDYLNGKGGNDILNGGAGADTMVGGLENDTYVIDNTGDKIQETSVLATEIDTVQSSISFTLRANLERLTLTGTTAINGTGNSLNNILSGNSANNTLNAGLGRDTLTGGGGNDRLYLGNDTVIDTVNYTMGDSSDIVFNFVRGAGRDRLNFSGITAIDVRVSGSNTLFRVGDGITGNAGFGTGDLLLTTNGTKGFVAGDVGVNLIGASFAFS